MVMDSRVSRDGESVGTGSHREDSLREGLEPRPPQTQDQKQLSSHLGPKLLPDTPTT